MGCTHLPLGTTAMSMQVLTFVCNIPSQLLQPMFLSEIKNATKNISLCQRAGHACCQSELIWWQVIMGRNHCCQLLVKAGEGASSCRVLSGCRVKLCGPGGSTAPRPTLLQPVLGHHQHLSFCLYHGKWWLSQCQILGDTISCKQARSE